MKYRWIIPVVSLFGCAEPCKKPGTLCTVVGSGAVGLAEDGSCALDAPLYWPADITVGPDHELYLADWNNHRLVRILTSQKKCHAIEVLTGAGFPGDGPEGLAANALWNHPTQLSFAPDGSIRFAAWHNSRVVGFEPGGEIWFEAGTGERGFHGDGGAAIDAAFDLPSSVVLGPNDTWYVSDQANQRIRAIDANGIVTTVVGTGEVGDAGDGGAAIDAQLQSERSQDAEPAGRIAIAGTVMYIADTSNHRIRAVDLETGLITNFAGTGGVAPTGTGVGATEGSLHFPRDVAVGPDGAVYIADSEDHCIRRVADDQMDIVAGICGEKGISDDGLLATESLLDSPYGIDVGLDGALWIADTGNYRIRRVTPPEN